MNCRTLSLSRQAFRSAVDFLIKNGLATILETTFGRNGGCIIGLLYKRVEEEIQSPVEIDNNHFDNQTTTTLAKNDPLSPHILIGSPLNPEEPPKKTNKKKVPSKSTDIAPSSNAKQIRKQATDEFNDTFWPQCRNKKAVAAARSAYIQVRLKGKTDLGAEELAKLYNKQLDEAREPQFAKHPSTWLNQECWSDAKPTKPRRWEQIPDPQWDAFVARRLKEEQEREQDREQQAAEEKTPGQPQLAANRGNH